MSTTPPKALDVRPLPTDRKLQAILAVFEDLEADGSFVLVDDQDPATVRRRIEEAHPGEIRWTYLQRGPRVWYARLVRLRVEA
ncbi:MAG: DUF2249 domain-containing protein [Salinibacter sp.]|uniref:DUF2249 domain-containing protein n=1 Tax=Salinibacter sp. TaxID=2065818 RepID=UPI0035D42385